MNNLDQIVDAAARKNNVNYYLLRALIMQESGGRNNAVSSKGARGLGQLMPQTARKLGIKNINDPEENVHGAAKYLRQQLETFDSIPLALAAYNSGPGSVIKYGGVPPFNETKNFVRRILGSMTTISTARADEAPTQDSEWVTISNDSAPADDNSDWQTVTNDTSPPDAADDSGDWVTVNDTPTPGADDSADWVTISNDTTPTQTTDNGKTLNHKLSVSGRGIIEGITALPGNLYNMSQLAPNYIAKKLESATGFRHPFLDSGMAAPESIDTGAIGSKLSDAANLDKPTEDDSIIYPVAKAVGEFVIPTAGMAKYGTPAVQAVGKALGGLNPLPSIAGIVAGKTASEGAKRAGLSDKYQAAADIAGNVIVSPLSTAVSGIIQAGGTAGKIAVGKGLESVAGRTLNRAAGTNSPAIIDMLAKNTVPTIRKGIKNYNPTTSEIAGNPGVSTIMRQTGMDVNSLAKLGERKFSNVKAISDYAEKAAGSAAKRAQMEATGLAKIDAIAKPMRLRNKPVDLTGVKATIDEAITRHTGNKGIVSTLEKLKRDLPSGDEAGFNEVYNFKQYLDEMLRGNPLSDPKIASLQRASSALKETKKALSESLTKTEPEFQNYIKSQAINIRQQINRDTARDVIDKSKLLNPLISNAAGQEEVLPMSAQKITTLLKNDKVTKNLTLAQMRQLENAATHSKLSGRTNLGMMVGSNTAQNLSVQDAVFNDIMAAGLGENPGFVGGALKGAANLATKILNPTLLSTISRDSTLGLARILAKAELDPKYAATLMKTYGLGYMNFNDAAGRAAIRGVLTSNITHN